MSETLLGVLGGALAGFITGLIGAVVGPLVQWAIQKRRDKFEYRRNKIKWWRDEISAAKPDDLLDLPAYADLREHLGVMAITFLEKDTIYVGVGPRQDSLIRQRMLAEITDLEKAWDLV